MCVIGEYIVSISRVVDGEVELCTISGAIFRLLFHV